MAPPGLPRFNVGDVVFAYTTEHSWFIAKVAAVAANAAFKPLTEAQRKSAVADSLRTVQNSAFLYTVTAQDPLFKLEGVSVSGIAEWHVELYDEGIVRRPVDDLLSLTHLHDGSILRTLAVRYYQDIVYTNIGVIVVALNPFNFKIPHYQEARMGGYLAEKGQMISDRLLPHSWAQAHNTYFELCSTRVNQSILISGESGAGKTEAAKIVLRYLSVVSVAEGSDEEKHQAQKISASVTACSPILEAFGNAKTVRNDNSSRFGKLLTLKFDPTTRLLRGAYTTKYLLEKSRIITCGPDERLYHAFYLALKAPDATTTNRFNQPVHAYKSVFAGKCVNNKEFSTLEDYNEVSQAMKHVGVDAATTAEVWKIASGVVHCCNCAFVAKGEGSALAANADAPLRDACALWGVDYDTVLAECTTTTVTIMKETTVKLLPVHKANDVRDAMCKAVYGNLFEWLVECCNKTCDTDVECDWIALLDIFGFEDFKSGNSFEQLCINYANETLQQHYNWCVFTKDIEMCKEEGIDTVDITFPDLQPTLNMIERALLYLDDECQLGNTEKDYLYSVSKNLKDEVGFMWKPNWQTNFAVHHFAGTVTYTVTGWIEKNRDNLKESLKAAFSASTVTNTLTRDLFPCQARMEAAALAAIKNKGGKAPKAITLGGFFKNQMKELMAVINTTNPHWIRCVKPHPAKRPQMLDGAYTLCQLEFAGILGTVKIRKAGYPIRFPHLKFCRAFNPVCPALAAEMSPTQAKAHCKRILEAMGCNDKKFAQIGKTIVFIKNDAYFVFEGHRRSALKVHAMLLQRVGRGYRRRVRTFQLSQVLLIQRVGRGALNKMRTFEVFCERHRERIIEDRRRREEERREAERRARLEAERLAKLAVKHEAQRTTFETEYEPAGRDAICREEEAGLIALYREHAALERALMMERLSAVLLERIQPMHRAFVDGCEAIARAEAAQYLELLRYDFYNRVAIYTMDACWAVEQAEEAARIALRRDLQHTIEQMAHVRSEAQRKLLVDLQRAEYCALLAAGRESRQRAEEERRQRALERPRTGIGRELETIATGYVATVKAAGPQGRTEGTGEAAVGQYLRQAIPTSIYQYRSPLASNPRRSGSAAGRSLSPGVNRRSGASPVAASLAARGDGLRHADVGARVFIPYLNCTGVVIASQVASSGRQSVGVCLIQPTSSIGHDPAALAAAAEDEEGDVVRWVETADVVADTIGPEQAAAIPSHILDYHRRCERRIRQRHLGLQVAAQWEDRQPQRPRPALYASRHQPDDNFDHGLPYYLYSKIDGAKRPAIDTVKHSDPHSHHHRPTAVPAVATRSLSTARSGGWAAQQELLAALDYEA